MPKLETNRMAVFVFPRPYPLRLFPTFIAKFQSEVGLFDRFIGREPGEERSKGRQPELLLSGLMLGDLMREIVHRGVLRNGP